MGRGPEWKWEEAEGEELAAGMRHLDWVDKRSAGFAGVREGSLQALIHHRHHHPRPRGPSSSFLLWLETSPHLQEEQWESFIWLISHYLATPDWTNSTDTIRYKWVFECSSKQREVIVRKNTGLLTILLLIFIIVFFLAVHISVHLSILQGQRLLMQTHSASSESVGKSEFPVGNVLWNAPSARITPLGKSEQTNVPQANNQSFTTVYWT